MQFKMNVRVMAAKRFKMENMAMSQLYIEGSPVVEADKIGCPPMKMNGDFEVLESLRGHIPGEFELLCEFRQGAGDKASQYVIGARPVTRSPVGAPSSKPAPTN